jgi:uncharacterized protein YndB with AHSA1/START domain
MARAVETVIVNQPIEVVFAFLADGSNNAKWRPDVVNTIFASGPTERAVWAQTSRRPNGGEYATDYRISWYDEPTRLEYTVFAGPHRPIGVYALRTASHGTTEVTLTVDLTPRWMILPVSSFGRRAADAEAASVLGLPAALS